MFTLAGRKTRKNGPAGIAGAAILLCLACLAPAKQVGKFSYRGTPEDYTTPKFNGTVTVSDTMVAMSEKIHVINKLITATVLDTPSIFFIIDHSSSMMFSTPNNDLPGNRFKVTSAFIDTIYKKFPSAEIGYAVFQSRLYYRAKDNPLFHRFPTSYDNGGAYLPLRKLNGLYGGETGIAIAKRFLQTKPVSMGGIQYTDLTYTPSSYISQLTNICVGFDAAKDAFSNALQKTKECHYIIFLSDGDANEPESDPFEFVNGTKVPTAFTIFFTKGTAVPANIATMTGNIRQNGYSLSNPKSKHWPFQNTTFNALMNFLMVNIFDSIMTVKPAPPISITAIGQTVAPWNPDDSSFTFNNPFPLTGPVTPFRYRIKYPVKSGDTTVIVDFNVKRQAGFLMPPADFDTKLWDRDILFRFNNAPITAATEAMSQIELSFPWNGGTAAYKYTNVTIDLYTIVPPVDHESVTLTAGTGVFTGTFRHAGSAAATPGNGILENAQNGLDSIVAVFRNSETPKLPLDTLRVAIIVNPPVFLNSALTHDLDGNGYLDHITIAFDKAVDIAKTAGSLFSIPCNNVTFPVDSIVKLTDSTYSLCLKEQTQNPVPQTSWKPSITITGLAGVSATGFVAADGAPPVVWTAVKQIVNADDKTTDTVTVTLSEKINGQNGAPFVITNQPYQTFFVWTTNGVTFTTIDTMLAGITVFTKVLDDSILVFSMSNGHDLTADHRVNIQALQQLLSDKPGNFPTDSNQKVQVKVVYKIPASLLDSAITRDVDGNGYLDHIELYFSKITEIPKSAVLSFAVRCGATTFPVDSVVRITNRLYLLYLRQHAEPSPLETSWKPTITILQVPGVADVTDRPALDGAAPVIWTVVKEIVDASDYATDVVTVTMSEKLFVKGLSKFPLTNQPARIFNAWIKPIPVTFTKVDTMFTGIVTFSCIPDDSTLVFTMTNGRNLTNSNWANIMAPEVLCDGRSNFPTDSNRKVRVRVKSPPITITVFPNPSRPTVKQQEPKKFVFEHQGNALKWVYEDRAGVVISLKNVELPSSGTLEGYIRIYDAAGNAVNWDSRDIAPGLPSKQSGPVSEINIYWNGFNKSGVAVAPGVYRVLVRLNYPGTKGRTLFTKAGIRPK